MTSASTDGFSIAPRTHLVAYDSWTTPFEGVVLNGGCLHVVQLCSPVTGLLENMSSVEDIVICCIHPLQHIKGAATIHNTHVYRSYPALRSVSVSSWEFQLSDYHNYYSVHICSQWKHKAASLCVTSRWHLSASASLCNHHCQASEPHNG